MDHDIMEFVRFNVNNGKISLDYRISKDALSGFSVLDSLYNEKVLIFNGKSLINRYKSNKFCMNYDILWLIDEINDKMSDFARINLLEFTPISNYFGDKNLKRLYRYLKQIFVLVYSGNNA